MGKKTDALLRRNSNTRKIESLVKLAIARVNIVNNQHRVRCSLARSDVVQLLNLGHQDRALLRVEQVIKEQNMLDVLDMIQEYSDILIKRPSLLKNNSECPEDLNEAISSLIFAASRCGELPELHEIRVMFSLMYGKEYTDCAIELRTDCKVNPKMIQKLSTRRPSMESSKYLLNQIASDNGIVFRLVENANAYTAEKNRRDAKHIEKHIQTHEAANLKDPEISIDTRLSATEVQAFSQSIKTCLSIRDGEEHSK